MRLDPHVLGLLAGTLLALGGCSAQPAEITSTTTVLASGSEASITTTGSSENGSSENGSDTDAVANSDETSDGSTIVQTSQGGIAEEDYPVPCGRG